MTRQEELKSIIYTLKWDIDRQSDKIKEIIDDKMVIGEAEKMMSLSMDLIKYIRESEKLK